MKLKNMETLNSFLAAVNASKGVLWLESDEGDRYNLKSTLCQYLALNLLLASHGNKLDLVCSCKEDEALFAPFLAENA